MSRFPPSPPPQPRPIGTVSLFVPREASSLPCQLSLKAFEMSAFSSPGEAVPPLMSAVAGTACHHPRLTQILRTLVYTGSGQQLPFLPAHMQAISSKEFPLTLFGNGPSLPPHAAWFPQGSPPTKFPSLFTWLASLCRQRSQGLPHNRHSTDPHSLIQHSPHPPPVPGPPVRSSGWQWHLARKQQHCLGEGRIISHKRRNQAEKAAWALGAHASV